jgi:hypothetical protein
MLEKAALVLQGFHGDGPMSLSHLGKRTDLSRSTVHRLVTALCAPFPARLLRQLDGYRSVNALAGSVFAALACELFDQRPGGRFTTRRKDKLAVSDYSGRSTTCADGTRLSVSSPQRRSTHGTLSPLRPEPHAADARCPCKRVNSTSPTRRPERHRPVEAARTRATPGAPSSSTPESRPSGLPGRIPMITDGRPEDEGSRSIIGSSRTWCCARQQEQRGRPTPRPRAPRCAARTIRQRSSRRRQPMAENPGRTCPRGP